MATILFCFIIYSVAEKNFLESETALKILQTGVGEVRECYAAFSSVCVCAREEARDGGLFALESIGIHHQYYLRPSVHFHSQTIFLCLKYLEWLKSFDMTNVFCGRMKRARSRKTQDCLFNSYWSRAPLLSWSSHIVPGPELVGHTAAKIQSNDALFSTL